MPTAPNSRLFRPLALFALAALSLIGPFSARAGAGAGAAPQRPNIIVILGDDMGWSDLGCYGGEVETPNLDRLAAQGLRLTQFYNTARCCPTRASLLTGLYPHQAGIGHMMDDRGHIGYRGELNRESVTLAEALRPAGYGTYAAGKWHVTKGTQPEGPKHNWPLQRGFDRFYGTITGAGSFYDPGTLTRDNTMISPFADAEYRPERFYYTDAINDHGIRFVSEHAARRPKDPFFLYLAHTSAHWPMHALDDDVAKYRGRFAAGHGPLREARLARLRKMGLVDPAWELSPQAEQWDKVENRAWEARCMEVYAAMIDRMDQGIGRLVSRLQELGQLDNTLILYMQDNGGCAETVGRAVRDGIEKHPDKPLYPPIPRDSVRLEIIPRQDREGYPLVMGPGAMPGGPRTYIAYGRGWANVSNTPFREYKHWVHEGGISTPLIAHWPRAIRNPRRLDATPGHLVDIMATCIDVAGADYPDRSGAEKIQPMEGRSLAPLFRGEKQPERALYWEHEGNRAIRIGRWKLVARGKMGPWELYDIDRDRTEMHDLAADQPERVREMASRWNAWASRARVLPLDPQPVRPAARQRVRR